MTVVLRVLVVDDFEDSTEIMCVLLEALGHDARGAFTAAEAIAIASEFDPHVVILDIGLPDRSGYDLARELRRRAAGKRLHLAAITGWGTTQDRVEALAAGFDQHYLKPADERVVREIVDGAIRGLASPVTMPSAPP